MEQASQIKGPRTAATDQLIKFGKFFSRWDETEDGRAVFRENGREGDASTATVEATIRKFALPGVNCQLLLLEGVRQGRHYHLGSTERLPSVGSDRPSTSPRLPPGAAFSWYTYSPHSR